MGHVERTLHPSSVSSLTTFHSILLASNGLGLDVRSNPTTDRNGVVAGPTAGEFVPDQGSVTCDPEDIRRTRCALARLLGRVALRALRECAEPADHHPENKGEER